MLTKCFLKQTMYAESRCQKTNAKLIPYAKTHMLKKCKHDLSSNQHTERVMKYKKNQGEVTVTVTVTVTVICAQAV